MPNILDANGLQVQTQAELLAYFTAAYQQIYGSDINLDSDTPDGQWMNIQIQAILDVQDLLVSIYNSFSVQLAIGDTLDERVAINGIQRQGGTYTITPVTITTTQSVNLYGLDQTAQDVYTVQDNAGNKWLLQTTQIGLSAGENILNFQAAVPGAQLTIPNTITVQFTVVLGVSSVNNPTTYTTLGVNEESDFLLKIRQQKSTSLASQGYLQGLLAALENIPGMTSTFVYENDTNTTDGDGVPGHSIWVIVAGTAAAADIAQAIYVKRNAGCGMFGEQSYEITQVDGTLFEILWDDVEPVNLFISFTATSLNSMNPPNIQAILAGLPLSFAPGVNQEVNINALATQVQIIDSNTLVLNAGFSDGQTQIMTLSGVAASGTFLVNYNGHASATINWNDTIGTIQTKVRAITGLAAANVTGSIASQTLTFDLSAIDSVAALLFVTNNSLQTSGSVAITFSYNEGYTSTLTPNSKKNQFIVSAANIIITPIVLLPATSQVAPTAHVDFVAYGGYGSYTYSLSINNSGGSINSTTGIYTAGSTELVTDQITVTDSFGNTQTATVTVT